MIIPPPQIRRSGDSCHLVASGGFEVSTAADEPEARPLLRSRPYAASVTDMELPLLSGLQRVEACAKALPILAMTSNPTPDDEVRAFELGAEAHLEKGPEVAPRVLRSLLKHLSTGTPSPT